MDHDVAARFGGSLERSASVVRSRMLVVVSGWDPVVDPVPAREFAALAGAELLTLDGRCGHEATRCQRSELFSAVRAFLDGGGAQR